MTGPVRVALFGQGVVHSKSPRMHQAAAKALGLNFGYNAVEVATEEAFKRWVGELRSGMIHGANVTVPFKLAAAHLVDELDPVAKTIGAVNTIARRSDGSLVGYNTDGPALRDELQQLCPRLSSKWSVVLGAGGAGLAAAWALREVGMSVVGMTTRSWNDSETLFESPSAQVARGVGVLTAPWPDSVGQASGGKGSQALMLQWIDMACNADIIVQTAGAGPKAGPADDVVTKVIPWARLRRDTVCYDVVYEPPVTGFVRAAQVAGLTARSGLGMLVRQAELAFEIWTGLPAPPGVMRAAAEAMGSGHM